ncbi:MAG: neutral/alkaline non-lysosomal ceramidase N-terminal domain-containing protein [Planctomycetes bacterium]|nr:neutral/alkaline non-lysosomal ceramidase N-terminal domain-containing protein [Planctomycetota bacterium]
MRAIVVVCGLLATTLAANSTRGATLEVGFASADVTPELRDDCPVWVAGYGPGRRATGIHDPLMARALVMVDGTARVAIVGVDSIGLQLPTVRRIRERLADYAYVLVASTHDHEAPDVVGIWGPTPFQSGVDDDYLNLIVERTVAAVREAEKNRKPATTRYGTASAPKLLRDSRLPHVVDDVLRVVAFYDEQSAKPVGLLVQWNCHPEELGSRNTLLTADFVYATVAELERRYGCPVTYVSGSLGGLMAPPGGLYSDDSGKPLPGGTYEYAERYGRDVAEFAAKAVDSASPLTLTPMKAFVETVYVPVENPVYRAAQTLGVLNRDSFLWTGDPLQRGERPAGETRKLVGALETEVGVLRLGELRVACIPGELYPELVYGKLQEPVEPNADYPQAPAEPHVTKSLGDDKLLILNLANDEIGYLIPKRQWDQRPPYCYGRTKDQYGEINSCSVDAAAIVMQSLERCARRAAE